MNSKIIGGIIALVVIISGTFYAGMTYANMSRGGGGGNVTNISAEDRARPSLSGGPTGVRGMGVGFTTGEVITKDDTGITVKMQDGSTKIVLIGSSAQIMKSTAGSVGDLAVGTQVSVTGATNGDGSVTAQSVQIGASQRGFTGSEPSGR